MRYERITKATFIERENRFVARVRLTNSAENGRPAETTDHDRSYEKDCPDDVRVHVKNTGRCRELLVPGATVYLEDHIDVMRPAVVPHGAANGTGVTGAGRPGRKYRYSLVAVEKKTGGNTEDETPETILINMDSQAPNKVVQEALLSGTLKLPGLDGNIVVRPEVKFGSSRFDFCIDTCSGGSRKRADESENGSSMKDLSKNDDREKTFIEVKGVTLEENGIARFPDAPTQRGVKHIGELEQAHEQGYGAYMIFVIQMEGMKSFQPNDETHPQFGEALRHAKATGVKLAAYSCKVTEDSLVLDKPVKVDL